MIICLLAALGICGISRMGGCKCNEHQYQGVLEGSDGHVPSAGLVAATAQHSPAMGDSG